MTTVPLGRVASLTTTRASGDEKFRIGLEAIESGTGRLVPDPATDYGGEGTAFGPGDVLFGKLRPYLAKAWLADRQGSAVGDFHVYRASPDRLAPEYLRWLLLSRSFLDPVESSVFGAKMPRVSWDFVRTVDIFLPGLSEQRAIADYLDRETAQIDTLIAKQEALIEVLLERRVAAIDATVAHLIAPEAQLRRGIRFLTSGSRGWGNYYADEGDRFVRIGNLPRKTLKLRGEIQYVELPSDSTEGERTRLQVGDLLFSITAYLGSVAVVDEDWSDAYVSQHVALCRLNTDLLDPEFVGYCMLSTRGWDQLNKGAAGGTKVQLALDDIRSLTVPFPTKAAQREAVDVIVEHTSRIDALIAKAETFIALAKERRSALITAAVTGQIEITSEAA